uniref:NADH:ubiquinone oxidoreductase subunit A7 n=1 Tax=Poecilia reticulata TaxID=8081 RepID=A0A3P9NSJ9_POERE
MATATKIIQRLRNLLAGHDLQSKLQLRYEEIAKSDVAKTTKAPVTPGTVYEPPPLSTDEPYL